jgi:hypothetical protein
MKRFVASDGSWSVLDASSLDTSIDVEAEPGRPVPAMQWNVYCEFRRQAIALDSEDVLDVITQAFEPEPDFDAICLRDFAQIELQVCIRIGMTLNDGWFDALPKTAAVIAALRSRFEQADRPAPSIERAKALLRRALPCTSEELNRLASAESISAKTLQRARRALGVEQRERPRDADGRVTGYEYRWTSPPN